MSKQCYAYKYYHQIKSLIAFLLFLSITFIGIAQSPPLNNSDRLLHIDFCDLPHYIGSKVFIKCIYRGVDEYWSLHPIDKGCKEDVSVELEINEHSWVPLRFSRTIKKLNENYTLGYIVLELTGRVETGAQGGYGHLGTNNFMFVVHKVVKAPLVRRRRN